MINTLLKQGLNGVTSVMFNSCGYNSALILSSCLIHIYFKLVKEHTIQLGNLHNFPTVAFENLIILNISPKGVASIPL